jgi:cytochrome oxidase assembly protein ShyY1
MFNLFAHTESMKDMVTFAQMKPVLAGLVLIIIGLLAIIIYLVNTWQPKRFTEKQKATAAASKKKSSKK